MAIRLRCPFRGDQRSRVQATRPRFQVASASESPSGRPDVELGLYRCIGSLRSALVARRSMASCCPPIVATRNALCDNGPVGRFADLRRTLTYGNVVATLALFVALGGASYAATALPPNSVRTSQLNFPLGIASGVGRARSVPVPVCNPHSRGCIGPTVQLAHVSFSLKQSSQVLVLVQAWAVQNRPPAHAYTRLSFTLPGSRGQVGRQVSYELGAGPITVSYSEIISVHAGSQTIGVAVDAPFPHHGTTRVVHVYDPEITVIALPPLHQQG